MAFWNLPSGPARQFRSIGSVTNSGYTVVTVTGDTLMHVKGAYTELIASTAEDAFMLNLVAANSWQSAQDTSMLLDVAIGGAGSETIILNNVQVGFRQTASAGIPNPYQFPIYIPSGSRISARVQCAQSLGDTVEIGVGLWGRYPLDGNSVFTSADTIGANTATSYGVALSVPGATNTKGSWTEIVASTANSYGGLVASPGFAGDNNVASGSTAIDIAIGAAGSEQIIYGDMVMTTNGNELIPSIHPNGLIPIGAEIPAGSRLAARYSTTSTATSVDMILFGLRR